MANNITYKRLMKREEEAKSILETMKNFIGDTFYVPEDALSYLRGLAGHYAFGAYQDDKLVGLIFGRLLANNELSYYRRFVSDFLLDDLLEDFFNKRGGAINVLVFEPSTLSNNDVIIITKELTNLLMDTLSQTAEVVFVDATVDDKSSIYAIWIQYLLDIDFKEFGFIEKFWYDYTVERTDAICPKCGNPCICDAHILYKRI